MSTRKGFTLIEIIIVLIIITILTVIAMPNFINSMMQGQAKTAQSNLIAIYNAQKNFYLNNGAYCLNTSPSPCNNLANINNNLSLNIVDTNFTYICRDHASGFTCTAGNIAVANLLLIVTGYSIILPGGTGCTASPWVAPCNPSCTATTRTYCPS